ncbi:MAG: hypothetical protein GTN89_13575 [Acidobacteria bacterium]|nr:hypothetical protein [Acidobacteriota bacterium]NIM60381.1 hypothetical protein [Acidobacteriota bacterium]NIO60316.1 hypothetical protein [Acidobacteriota bacterium]NIQ31371.1 hypothetical protein [Acidobacteriota bacterium]NIQ86594.1 hypothetical protein [Acidobacteriota bacterium]
MGRQSDIVVAGAGPGGALAAGLLARAGFEVALLDRSEFPREKTCGDALTPRAVAVLTELGLLESIRPDALAVARLEVVGPAGGSFDIPLQPPEGAAEACLVVRRRALDDTIRRWAVEGGAWFAAPVRVARIEGGEDGVRVTCADGDVWSARAGIVATGSDAGMLRRSGLLEGMPPVMLASRTYFEGGGPPVDRLQFRFDSVRLPAYGWVFPLPGDCWNVGVLVYPPRREPASAKRTLNGFLDSPAVALDAGRGAPHPQARGLPATRRLRDCFDRGTLDALRRRGGRVGQPDDGRGCRLCPGKRADRRGIAGSEVKGSIASTAGGCRIRRVATRTLPAAVPIQPPRSGLFSSPGVARQAGFSRTPALGPRGSVDGDSSRTARPVGGIVECRRPEDAGDGRIRRSLVLEMRVPGVDVVPRIDVGRGEGKPGILDGGVNL